MKNAGIYDYFQSVFTSEAVGYPKPKKEIFMICLEKMGNLLPSETIMALKQKRTVLNQLKKQLGANRNLMEALSVLPKVDNSCKNSLKNNIRPGKTDTSA